MPDGSLEGPIAKVSRAIEHYRGIKSDFLGGFDLKFRPVTTQPNGDALRYEFRVGEVEPIDPRFALVLGDGFYNLRSALDHLAYQLHVSEIGDPLPDQIERQSTFPVCDDPPATGGGRVLRTDEWRGIRNLSGSMRADIERLQPYNGWHDHHLTPRPVVSQMRQTLHEVNWFNLRDKHRQLHLVETMPRMVALPPHSLTKYGVSADPVFGVALESHAHVDTWTFDSAPPADEVNVHPGIHTAVVVEPTPGDRVDVVSSLGASILGVRDIIGLFAHLFPPCAQPTGIGEVRQTVE